MFYRKKIGLALGSGGARGFALIGVLRVLVENKIPIDYISGTSVGAVVGGSYAINGNLDKLEELVTSFPYKEMLASFLDINLKDGLVNGAKFLKVIKSIFGTTKIEDTKIPFIAVATEKISGDEVLLKKGSIAEAMRASSSIPILFAPHKTSDKTELLDGGVTQQVPVDVVRDMGADVVIAVNLSENCDIYNPKSRFGLMEHYLRLMFKSLARANVRNADIVISPSFKKTNWLDNYRDRELLIKEGEEATRKALPAIKKAIKKLF